uniref:Uncharacterized protein n=1 Tax=Pipistrellus kuhlii TaxID=59472 RepID=A0A7J7SFD7_PIPKU|nr:hypothetical protein mPipKuh1_009988 [Pipistrellus kuhlii]
MVPFPHPFGWRSGKWTGGPVGVRELARDAGFQVHCHRTCSREVEVRGFPCNLSESQLHFPELVTSQELEISDGIIRPPRPVLTTVTGSKGRQAGPTGFSAQKSPRGCQPWVPEGNWVSQLHPPNCSCSRGFPVSVSTWENFWMWNDRRM